MDIRRSHIIIALVVFTVVALMIRPDILSELFVFFFMGIVPGTDVTLPWWVTLTGMTIALVISLRWLLSRPAYHPVTTAKDRSLRHSARKRVLKQTKTHTSTSRHYKKQAAKA